MTSIKVDTVPFNGAQDASIVISWPHGGIASYMSFKSAECGCIMAKTKLDGGALCAALFSLIKSKIFYPAHVAAGTNITSINCSVNNTHMIIAANCNKSGGKLKKLITDIVKCLNPFKGKAEYAMLIKRLGIKPDKDSFEYCASSMCKGLNKGLAIGLYGKVGKLSDELIGKIELNAEDKLPDCDSSQSGSQRSDYGREIDIYYDLVDLKFSNQFEAVIAQDYLMSIRAVFEHVHDGVVTVEKSFIKAISSADKDSKYKKYAERFMKSRHDESVERLIYYAAGRACFTVAEANEAVSKKVSSAAIMSIIKKAF